MSLGQLHRKKTVITVHVANRPRRFILRAPSVVDHLERVGRNGEIREAHLAGIEAGRKSDLPTTVVAYATLAAAISQAVPLLQEPADGAGPLTEEDGWELRLGDAQRVLTAQAELIDLSRLLGGGGEACTEQEAADTWLDVGTTIAQARLAPDAQTPLSAWSMEQIVETYWRASRILWREWADRMALAGGKPGPEPDFKKGSAGKAKSGGVDSAPFTEEDEVRYAKMKADLEAQMLHGGKTVFPAQMGQAAEMVTHVPPVDDVGQVERAAKHQAQLDDLKRLHYIEVAAAGDDSTARLAADRKYLIAKRQLERGFQP